MWQNIITISLRLMAKHRLFFMINLIGLALGLMAIVLIVTYVRDQLSYDAWVPEGDQIYRIGYTAARDTGAPFVSNTAQGVLAPTLKETFGDKLIATRYFYETERFQKGDRFFDTRTVVTEPDYFDVFQVESLYGDPKEAILDPNKLIVTKSIAEKYFGRTDVLGETISIAGGKTYKIGAVLPDWSDKSHHVQEQFRLLVEADYPGQDWRFTNWQATSAWTYVKLAPGFRVSEFEPQLQALLQRNLPETANKARKEQTLIALKDIYTDGREELLVALLIVAAFILIIAGINFINLTLSRLVVREKEVAIRRVVGASKGQVTAQFLLESCVTTFLALALGVAMAELVLPTFNQEMGTNLHLNLLADPVLLMMSIGLVLVVGLGAGAVPALSLAQMRPTASLSSGNEEAGSINRRAGPILVVIQFSLAIGLIVATWVVYHQTSFALNRDKGFDLSNKIVVFTRPNINAKVRGELARLPGVTSAVTSFSVPGGGGELSASLTVSSGETIPEIMHFANSADFLSDYKVKPLAGRLLSKDLSTDSFRADLPEGSTRAPQSVVINDQARQILGFETPAAAIDQFVTTSFFNGDGEPPHVFHIVGVVPSLKLRSVRHDARSLVFFDLPDLDQFITVSYQGRSEAEMMEAITEAWNTVMPNERLWIRNSQVYWERYHIEDKRQATLFSVFSGFAILIASLGLYGLSGFNAQRRTKEIGIRKVLGARIADIVQLFVWQFSKPVLVANLIAWPLAWWFLQDWLSQFVDRVDLTPFPFIAAGTAALLIAGGTVAGQAIKVARANPIEALKHD